MKNTTKKKFKKTAILASMILGALTLNNCKVEVTPGNTNNGSNNENTENIEGPFVFYITQEWDQDNNKSNVVYIREDAEFENVGNEFTTNVQVDFSTDANTFQYVGPFTVTAEKKSNNQIEMTDSNIMGFLSGNYEARMQKIRYTNVTKAIVKDDKLAQDIFNSYGAKLKNLLKKPGVTTENLSKYDQYRILGINGIAFDNINAKIKLGNSDMSNINDQEYENAKQKIKQHIQTDDFKNRLVNTINQRDEWNNSPLVRGIFINSDLQQRYYDEETHEGTINMFQEDIIAIEKDTLKIANSSINSRTFNFMYDYENAGNPNFNKTAKTSVLLKNTQKTR